MSKRNGELSLKVSAKGLLPTSKSVGPRFFIKDVENSSPSAFYKVHFSGTLRINLFCYNVAAL